MWLWMPLSQRKRLRGTFSCSLISAPKGSAQQMYLHIWFGTHFTWNTLNLTFIRLGTSTRSSRTSHPSFRLASCLLPISNQGSFGCKVNVLTAAMLWKTTGANISAAVLKILKLKLQRIWASEISNYFWESQPESVMAWGYINAYRKGDFHLWRHHNY